MAGLLGAVQRLERQRGVLGLAKLANVALGMFWGFVVTFVFVRVLPLPDFQAFLLLVAFANFTVSAEFGFSTIIYARLRAHLLTGEEDFRAEELGLLLAFMLGVIVLGGLLLGAALASGLVVTGYPALFLCFYGVAATNLVALLAKRALAALDHNLWWEGLDLVRRLGGIGLLIAALGPLEVLTSVVAQLALSLFCVILGFITLHHVLRLRPDQWFALRTGSANVGSGYLRQIGRTMLLTVSDIAAYNAPYFTIASATHDPRPLLLFDFLFKLSRSVSSIIRALTETAMPAITRALHGGDGARLSVMLRQLTLRSTSVALAIGIAMIVAGRPLAAIMFDGHLVPDNGELILVGLLLLGLVPICVSVYVQTGLARFAPLLPPSFAFCAGSLFSIFVAQWLAAGMEWPLSLSFATVYAGLHLLLGVVHLRMIGRVAP